MALIDRYALVEYDVPGPRVVHEKWALEHIADEDYIIVTPDRDIYCESLSILNPDLTAIRVRPGPNQLLPGVPAGVVHALPAWSPAEIAAIQADAATEAIAERARRGPVVAAPVAPVAAAVGVAAASTQKTEPVAPGARDLPDRLVWVAAETVGSVRFGEMMQGIAAPLVKGSKVVHTMPDGQTVFC